MDWAVLDLFKRMDWRFELAPKSTLLSKTAKLDENPIVHIYPV